MQQLRPALEHVCIHNGLIYSDRLAALLLKGGYIRFGANKRLALRNGNELVIVSEKPRCPQCDAAIDTANPASSGGCYRCAVDDFDEWL